MRTLRRIVPVLSIVVLLLLLALPMSASAEPGLAPSAAACSAWYAIKPGDTLNKIAAYYGTTAWRLARRTPGRAVFTVGGVAISCAALTLCFGLIHGLEVFLEGQTRTEIPANTVEVSPASKDLGSLLALLDPETSSQSQGANPLGEFLDAVLNRKLLTADQVQLLQGLPHVVSVSPGLSLWARSLSVEGVPGAASLVRVCARSTRDADSTRLASGAGFSSDEADEVILSAKLLEALGLYKSSAVLGKQVVLELSDLPMGLSGPASGPTVTWRARVVGVSPKSLLATVLVPEGRALALSRDIAADPLLGTPERYGFYAWVRVDEPRNVAGVAAGARVLGMGARTLAGQLESLGDVFAALHFGLGVVGAVLLAVAAMGILNTLLMSLYHRTRFVGLLVAVGASRGTVRSIFATEGVILGVTGALLGLAWGTLAGWWINQWAAHGFLAGWEGTRAFLLAPWFPGAMLAASALFGYLGSLYPAWQASRLDPVEALRHE